MLDLHTLQAEEVVGLVGEAKGRNREMLIEVPGYSEGAVGVGFLRSQLDQRGRGSGHLRAVALKSWPGGWALRRYRI